MSIAGHVSRKMLEHYSHIRIDAKRKALDAIAQPVYQQGYCQKSTQSEKLAKMARPN